MAKKAKEKPIFIASSPNTEKDDLTLACKLLLHPWTWLENHSGTAFDRMRTNLASFHHIDTSFLYNTGRAALYELLKAMGIGEGDEVVVQAFTCVAVPTSILWARATPIYVDIGEHSYNSTPENIQAAITSKTRAIIVQHTFGEISKVDEIREIVDDENSRRSGSNKIFLIEDCAHTIGQEYKGKRVGEWGDAAFFSFGQEKVISCTQGGAAIMHNTALSMRMTERYGGILFQNAQTVFKSLLHPLLWNIINTTYYTPLISKQYTIGRLLIMILRSLRILNQHVDTSLKTLQNPHIRKLSNAQATMLEHQWNKLHHANAHRKVLTATYKSLFPSNYTQSIGNYPLLRFPLLQPSPIETHRHFKKRKIIIGNWYSDPIHPSASKQPQFKYPYKSCPRAEEASQHTVNLPITP